VRRDSTRSARSRFQQHALRVGQHFLLGALELGWQKAKVGDARQLAEEQAEGVLKRPSREVMVFEKSSKARFSL
jgi:hypothetical protein